MSHRGDDGGDHAELSVPDSWSEPPSSDDDGPPRNPWREFQCELVAEIDAQELPLDDGAVYLGHEADEPTPPDDVEDRHYHQWLSALEHLLVGDGAIDEAALRDRAVEFASGAESAHEVVDDGGRRAP